MKARALSMAVGVLLLGAVSPVEAQELTASFVKKDVSKLTPDDGVWAGTKPVDIMLMAQPMAVPRPKTTETEKVSVQVVHDGRWLAVRLTWADPDKSEAGHLGEFSDAVAMQFPVRGGDSPPLVFMGSKDDPVHIFHWRAQYQIDKEKGIPTIKDLYPNATFDMYPMEFHDMGTVQVSEEVRDIFSPGRAEGNPQSYRKLRGVDEIFAEGFGSSTIAPNAAAEATGRWANGQWSVVITRPLAREAGSVLLEGGNSYMGFAVWQGGKGEVGSRKSVTMAWTPLAISAQKD